MILLIQLTYTRSTIDIYFLVFSLELRCHEERTKQANERKKEANQNRLTARKTFNKKNLHSHIIRGAGTLKLFVNSTSLLNIHCMY